MTYIHSDEAKALEMLRKEADERGMTMDRHIAELDQKAPESEDNKASESSTIVEMLQAAKAKLNSFRENFQRLPDRSPEQGHEPERREKRDDRDLEL